MAPTSVGHSRQGRDGPVARRSACCPRGGHPAIARGFVRPEHAGADTFKWAIGNTVATLARADDADAIIDILRDRGHGRSRQMLCDALVRTRDPRRIDVLIQLIDDDDLAGHAIVALRQCGYRRRVPEPDRVRPKLEALLRRPPSKIAGAGASPFAKRQARHALAAIDRAAADKS